MDGKVCRKCENPMTWHTGIHFVSWEKVEPELAALRTRVAELEAAIRAHRDGGQWAVCRELATGLCLDTPVMCRDHALYAVLREEVKG